MRGRFDGGYCTESAADRKLPSFSFPHEKKDNMRVAFPLLFMYGTAKKREGQV